MLTSTFEIEKNWNGVMVLVNEENTIGVVTGRPATAEAVAIKAFPALTAERVDKRVTRLADWTAWSNRRPYGYISIGDSAEHGFVFDQKFLSELIAEMDAHLPDRSSREREFTSELSADRRTVILTCGPVVGLLMGATTMQVTVPTPHDVGRE